MLHLTKAEHEDLRRAWLSKRCGHQWAFDPKGVVRCARCHRKQARNAPWRCPGRKLPNRWRMHFARYRMRAWYPATCAHCSFTGSSREVDGHTYREHFPLWLGARLRELEHDAKYLPQDMRHWKGHPVAIEYRKRVSQWWALSAADYQQAANLSPTINQSLTAKGQLSVCTAGARYLDRLYAERQRTTGVQSWRDRPIPIEDPQFERVQAWRHAHGFLPLDLPGGC